MTDRDEIVHLVAPADWMDHIADLADNGHQLGRLSDLITSWRRPPPSDDAYDATAILVAEAINANAPVDWAGLRLRQYSAIWANAARQKLADAGLLATTEDDDGCGWKQRYEALRAEMSREASDLDPQTGFPLHRREHRYLSTGCRHGEHGYCQSDTGLSGAKTPAQCKWCSAPCVCGCHEDASGT